MSEIGFRPTSATDVIEMAKELISNIFDVALFQQRSGIETVQSGNFEP